jgi:hypothetical protein
VKRDLLSPAPAVVVFALLMACGGSDLHVGDWPDAAGSDGAIDASGSNEGGNEDGGTNPPPSDGGPTTDSGPTTAPGACADACRQAHPNWQSNFNTLTLSDCNCGGCLTECQSGFICGNPSASESDTCIRCMAGALNPGGKCAVDPTFQQQCLTQSDCNAFASCIAACGGH